MNQHLNPLAEPGQAQFEAIAEFVLDTERTIPDVALRHCATLLIDTLGVAAGASMLEVGHIARNFAVDFHGAGGDRNAAHLLFDGRRVSVPGAAWALATQIDNLDGHDGYNPVKGHIGCAVVPALFAFAERHPDLTGPQALRALVMSYEVAARAGLSLHATASDYHTSGAWNALGVAALACRLDGTTQEVLRQAMGIAEYHGPRSQMMREIDNPTMLHDGSGMGALVGSSAALLAMRGFTGAPAITAEAADVAQFWADLGQHWTVSENYIKPYPSCRWGHAAIDALRKIMAENEGVNADTVASVEVRTFDEAARLFAGMPETTTQAQYSLHFVMAIMLKYGAVGPSHISDRGLQDPEVAKLIPKITAVSTQVHNARFPEGRWSDVEVVLTDGRRLQSGDVPASGGPGAWRSDKDVEEKFHVFCEGTLSPERTTRLWAMRDKMMDPAVCFSDLAALVYPGTDA
ncbi:MAG: MmgE/PrpD family protein [Pseudomonadota bacterium]